MDLQISILNFNSLNYVVMQKSKLTYPKYYKEICCLWFLKDHIDKEQLLALVKWLETAILFKSHYWRKSILQRSPHLLSYQTNDEFETICLNHIKYGKKIDLDDKFRIYFDIKIRGTNNFINIIKEWDRTAC